MPSGYIPNNPMSPYLSIKFMGKTYDIDVNFLKSMTVHRQSDAVGDFEFVIEDTMDLSLEAKLMQMINSVGSERISFQYGWWQGKKSPWYQGFVHDYKPSFHSNFTTTLTVQGFLMNKDQQNRSKTLKVNKISDAVRMICEDEGWQMVEIDESDALGEEREFVMGNVAPVDFIREKLEPEATSGGMPMAFYLHSDAGGQQAYFVRIDKHIDGVLENYNFMINCGNYGSVISFDPAYSGSQIASLAQEAGFLDQDTNEINYFTSIGDTKNAGYGDLTVYGATSPDRMRSLLTNRWYGRNIGNYNATLEIVGDPTLIPLYYVNVMPFRPDGSIHHTGGTYMIKEITDNIAGAFTTVLTLVKMDTPDGGLLPISSAASFVSKE